MLCMLALGFIIIVGNGCGTTSMTAQHGLPLNEEAINEIVIGKTTRSEIFKLLGTPHSIFKGQAEFQEGIGIPVEKSYYSHTQSRYLSSIDEDNYALLYRFGKSSSKSVLMIVSSSTRIRITNDELLIIINGKTDIVEDIAYRKETSSP